MSRSLDYTHNCICIPSCSSLEQVQTTTTDDANLNIEATDHSESNHEDNIKETNTESSTSDYEEIEYYRQNPAYPIYSKSRKVLSPERTVRLLMDDGALVLSKVCRKQPLLVEHHCTFVVDISSLTSQKDIKCDDMGAWRNNSSHKYAFSIEFEEDGKVGNIEAVSKNSLDRSITLKREYFQLKHDIHDDVRKRIDTIVGKFNSFNQATLHKLTQIDPTYHYTTQHNTTQQLVIYCANAIVTCSKL